MTRMSLQKGCNSDRNSVYLGKCSTDEIIDVSNFTEDSCVSTSVQTCLILLITDIFISAASQLTFCHHSNVCANNFSKSTRPRHILFLLKDTLSMEYENCSRHADLVVCLFARAITSEVSSPKV